MEQEENEDLVVVVDKKGKTGIKIIGEVLNDKKVVFTLENKKTSLDRAMPNSVLLDNNMSAYCPLLSRGKMIMYKI